MKFEARVPLRQEARTVKSSRSPELFQDLLQNVNHVTRLKVRTSNRVLDYVHVVIAGVHFVKHPDFFHDVNRRTVVRFGNGYNAFELMFFESEPDTGARQLSCQTHSPMGPGQVIDNLGRSEERSQSAESDELIRVLSSTAHRPNP